MKTAIFCTCAVRITGKLLQIDGYMLRGVWQALNCLFIHATFCVIATGASQGKQKCGKNNDFWPNVTTLCSANGTAMVSVVCLSVVCLWRSCTLLRRWNFTQLLNNKISLCLYLRITWPTAQISVTSFSIDQFHTAASVKKNRHFYVPRPFFCLPWGRPCGNHAKRCTDEKIIQCLPNPSQHVPIYIQQFPSFRTASAKKSPFSCTAAHIFVSPGDAPGAITLNVVWMEK